MCIRDRGSYYNPDFISLKPDGKRQTKRFPGYATDVVTDKSIPVSYTHLDVYKRQP